MPELPFEEAADLISQHSKGQGKRFPAEIRSQVLRVVEVERSKGMTWRKIAEQLGVTQQKLFRWRRQERSGRPANAFVPVRIVEARKSTPAEGLSLVTPSGYRLEGLTLESAANLLARLK